MKKFLVLLFLLPTLSHPKFAYWVVEIPCDKITLKISSCMKFDFNNREELSEQRIKNIKNFIIQRKGAITTANIEKIEPMKCHAKQKMDLNRFKKREFNIKKFFVSGLNCKEGLKSVIVKRPNFFCGTLGDNRLEKCFIPERSRKEKFVYTELIK
jgi:hypothetical protein